MKKDEYYGKILAEGTVKIGLAPKAKLREAMSVGRRLAEELSFEDNASTLLSFSEFLKETRKRFDLDTLPPVALVQAHRKFIRMY
jgi:hypothetical protein